MIRFVITIALLLTVPVASAQAEILTLNFTGKITAVKDASATQPDNPDELLDLEIPAVPVNSTFSGTITYDTTSPLTDSFRPGFARYLDLLSSSASLTVNSHNFATIGATPVSAQVGSEEANVGFSGVNYLNNALKVPTGWTTSNGQPYFTLQFWDEIPQARSVALPASLDVIPTDTMNLLLDFQGSVTIAGQTYGERVYVLGEVTSLTTVQRVTIDVDTKSADNKINLNTKNPKPLEVAVFGAANFDVRAVVPETIELGDPTLTLTGAGQNIAPKTIKLTDVNRDGRLDLLLTFDLLDLQDFGAIDFSSTSLEFQALLNNQSVVYGDDAVSIPGSKGKKK